MGTFEADGVRFQFSSDQSLLVYFGQDARADRSEDRPLQGRALQTNIKVRKLLRLLEQEPVAGVRNLHPGYCSLLVKFDALRMRHEEVEAILREYLEAIGGGKASGSEGGGNSGVLWRRVRTGFH